MKMELEYNVSLLSTEMKLLLELMNPGLNSPLFNKELLKKIDWNELLILAKHHRAYPIVYINLIKNKPKGIPIELIKKLHQEYIKNTLKMLQLSGEIEKLCVDFNEYRIKTLQLKGPVLAKALYGDLSSRTSSDIDLLISIHDLDKVEKILGELGYMKDDYIDTVLNDWKWRHHHVTYFHSDKKIKVEVHWRLNPGPGKEPSFEELWERRQKSTLTHYPIYMLSNEDLLFFLVTHGARHGWSRLRWLQDVEKLTRMDLDWHKVYQLLKRYDHLDVGGQALYLISCLFKVPVNHLIPFALSKKAKRLAEATFFYLNEKVNLHADTLPVHVSKYHTRYVLDLMTNRQKLQYFFSTFYPYPIDAKTLPLPESLHFLYFPLRPFLCTWRRAVDSFLLGGSPK